MNVELKNVKINQAMSEETMCFSATVYVDGKKAGTAMNRGHGGSNDYHWTDLEAGRKLEEHAKTVSTCKYEPLDDVIDGLMERFEVRKALTGMTRGKTLFRLVGDKPGEWRIVKAAFAPDVDAFLIRKYGATVEIVANRDLSKAVDLEMGWRTTVRDEVRTELHANSQVAAA